MDAALKCPNSVSHTPKLGEEGAVRPGSGLSPLYTVPPPARRQIMQFNIIDCFARRLSSQLYQCIRANFWATIYRGFVGCVREWQQTECVKSEGFSRGGGGGGGDWCNVLSYELLKNPFALSGK